MERRRVKEFLGMNNIICIACTHCERREIYPGTRETDYYYICALNDEPVSSINGCRDYSGPRRDDFFPECFDFHEEFISKEEFHL